MIQSYSKTSVRACPICQNRKSEALHTQKFALPEGHRLSGCYDIASCACCGFVYADRAVTQADYDRFYARFSKYEDQKTGTGGGEKPWDARRLQGTAKQIARFLHYTSAHILDICCANVCMRLISLYGCGRSYFEAWPAGPTMLAPKTSGRLRK
jgi:hypothetical protein